MVVFSYHFACWNRVGSKENGSKLWFFAHGKKGLSKG
nr:MAG TPA: hypothetical protein [Caudoviricetes sp.]